MQGVPAGEMLLRDRLVGMGRWLFRFRSWLPAALDVPANVVTTPAEVIFKIVFLEASAT